LEAAGLGLLGGTRGIGDGTRGILFLLVWAETLRFILILHVKYLMKRAVKLAGAEAVSRSVYCTSVKQAFRLPIDSQGTRRLLGSAFYVLRSFLNCDRRSM
jgi:hypothetical protein